MKWSVFVMAMFVMIPGVGCVAETGVSPVIETTTTRADWETSRAALLREWMNVLGPFPEKTDLQPEVLSSETTSGHTRHLVRYQTEPGSTVHAFLLVPDPAPKSAPGAIVFHGTSSNHIFQSAGLADAPTRHIGLNLVRRGYVVLAPRCFIFGYGEKELTTRPLSTKDYSKKSEDLLAKHPGWTGMGKMLWDGMRAVDYLQSRTEVDPTRIVCAGHSLGAKEALYLSAFDSRVAAGIASEGGVGLSLSNWNAPWYLGVQIKARTFQRDHHELLAMIAPRGFLVAGGGSADGENSRPWIDAAMPVFKLYNRPDSLRLILHDTGHNFPEPTSNEAFNWLDGMVSR